MTSSHPAFLLLPMNCGKARCLCTANMQTSGHVWIVSQSLCLLSLTETAASTVTASCVPLTFSSHEESPFFCTSILHHYYRCFLEVLLEREWDWKSQHWIIIFCQLWKFRMWIIVICKFWQNTFRKMPIWVLVIYLCIIKMCNGTIEKESIFMFSTQFLTILWSTIYYSSRPHSLDKL